MVSNVCPNCGAILSPTDKVCPKCGKEVLKNAPDLRPYMVRSKRERQIIENKIRYKHPYAIYSFYIGEGIMTLLALIFGSVPDIIDDPTINLVVILILVVLFVCLMISHILYFRRKLSTDLGIKYK